MSGVISKGRLTIPGLREQLARVDGSGFRHDLAEVCGAAALKLVADEFRRGVDPYGTPWEPIVRHRRRGGKKPLLDTGRLRASFAVQVVDGGFRMDATASYAPYHQYGARPARRRARFQPVDKRGRFQSRARAGKKKRGSVDVRFLPAGMSGGIPARPMVPTPDQGGLPYLWQRKFRQESRALVERTMGR